MTHEESAELADPGVCSFDNPASFVASELSAVLVTPVFAVLAIGHDEFDTALCEPLAQRIGVVGSVGDYAFGLLPRTTFGSRDLDFGERGFRKRNFSRRGTFEPNSQRKTATVDQYHPLRSLAALGFTDCGAPFFAGAKLPSRNASSHCFNRRQQVADEGIFVGQEPPRSAGL